MYIYIFVDICTPYRPYVKQPEDIPNIVGLFNTRSIWCIYWRYYSSTVQDRTPKKWHPGSRLDLFVKPHSSNFPCASSCRRSGFDVILDRHDRGAPKSKGFEISYLLAFSSPKSGFQDGGCGLTYPDGL